MLREATDDSKYLLALSDSDGVLLSVTGHPDALMVAGGGGFEPGHLCSEEALGTNAVGTALKLSHPVQIFSAEHFSRRLHGLTCSAAPIRDPETNRPIGVLNLSGDFRTCHPHSLTLVASVCRLIEETLAREQKEQDNRLRDLFIDRLGAGGGSRSALVSRSGRVIAAYPRGWLGRRMKVSVNGNLVLPSGIDATLEQIKGSGGSTLVDDVSRSPLPGRSSVMLEALPAQLVRASNGNWQVDLSPRHSEIVSLLALHPDGLSGEELRTLLRQPNLETVTVRAEISRIRRLLGPVILSRPYRLDPSVQADLRSLRQALDTD
jgi:hypothetical protein